MAAEKVFARGADFGDQKYGFSMRRLSRRKVSFDLRRKPCTLDKKRLGTFARLEREAKADGINQINVTNLSKRRAFAYGG